MITQVKIPLFVPENKVIRHDFAYNIYGAWMKALEPWQAGFLHESHSMNHYISTDKKGGAQLTVNLLDNKAASIMLPVFFDKKEYFLTKPNLKISCGEPQVITYTDKKLADFYFAPEHMRNKITLNLKSPATFKTNGRYAVFPSSDLIIKSAASRWALLGAGVSVDDEQAIRDIAANTVITDYRLSGTYYCIKDTRIQSFTGSVTLSIHSPGPMVRLFDMLMGALRFTGLGIKTSLGMGGVTL